MTEERLIRWKKIKGGVFILGDGTMIKKNETFMAAESEIPKAFRDSIRPIDITGAEVIIPTKEEFTEIAKNYYELESVGEGRQTRWNVRNMASNKIVNSKPMSKVKAEELLSQLS